jgi:phosphoribosyl 1,2-cyclic phosphodiesterase
MKISALASGSSGNCFYINHHDNGIIVDAGISCRQVTDRLAALNQNPESIKGIFVTHEHIDHVKGVDVLARKFNIPIFATKGTIRNCFLCSNEELINEIKNDETVKLAGLEIQAFSKYHDAADPVSYTIKNDKIISIITDIGKACSNVIDNVNSSDLLVIESNHDLRMLEEGPYPYFLKQRIGGDTGHLSNLHSGLCVLEHAKSKLKNVMLAHLSEVNNNPMLALNTFNSLVKERIDLHPKISLSTRAPTGLFNV